MKIIFREKKLYKIEFADESLHSLQKTFRVAQKMGEGLGGSKILFGQMPEEKEDGLKNKFQPVFFST